MENGDQSDEECSGEDKTFITKILGEMKHQFNNKSEEDTPEEEVEKIEGEVANEDKSNDSDGPPRLVMCFRKPDKKENVQRRTRKAKVAEVHLKRSTRRRSKDYSESVLQSAIARKEKSYNETSKPQRLTRQLKPTQKILDNIANAAALKQDKRKEKGRVKREETNDVDTSIESMFKSGKRNKRLRNNLMKDVGDSDNNRRRSDRVLSQNNSLENDIKEEVEEEVVEEEKITNNNTTEQLIASRLCVCSFQTQLYAYSDKEEVFCMAIDSIGNKLIGCNNLAAEDVPMLRPSPRVPYMVLCKIHRNRMFKHNCCPTCGIFCTQGQFSQCKNKHQYHRDCQLTIGDLESCPHCGESTSQHDICINMETLKPPVFSTVQKAQNPCPNVEDGASTKEERECPSPPIIPLNELKLTLNSKSKESSHYEVGDLLDAVRSGNLEQVATILGTRSVNLESPVSYDQNETGTVLHYAAKHGLLSVIHMLKITEINLDISDNEQNTPLMLSVVNFQNNTVKYLTKAGADITTKGMDGMTALHLSAKCGNLEASKILLSAAAHIKDYKNFADDGGWTPLVWGCEHNHVEIVKYLLSEGADPLLMDVEQNVALHWAAFSGSSKIVEMILNFGGQVNVVNSHGDSPLHIAARQDNYNCVLILLARGAKINTVNKDGNTPIDCCTSDSKSQEALSLNMHLQSFITVTEKPQLECLSNDISGGKELNPIPCKNEIDKTAPSNFTYITKNCTTSDVNVDLKITTLKSCICRSNCTSACECGLLSTQKWYENGRLSSNFNYQDPPVIFECNQVCTCLPRACDNRIVQKGSVYSFEMFRTLNKGWGIRSLTAITCGAFVCEYIGEIVTDTEADSRDDDSYLFDLDNRGINTYCIDAKYYGNFSRFINHSCNPNLVPVRVFIEHHDTKFPRIALFANRDIKMHEELSFDYGERFWIIKYKYFTCECDSLNCRYSRETILETLESYHARLQVE